MEQKKENTSAFDVEQALEIINKGVNDFSALKDYEKKYINSLVSNVLILGANDENFDDFETTGKYVLLGNKLFLNTNKDENIDLKDGLYIYYDPNRDYDTKENKTTIRLFTYSHDAGVKNKIDFKLTGQIPHCGKLDLLKYILINIDNIFPKNCQDNGLIAVRKKFLELFSPYVQQSIHEKDTTELSYKTILNKEMEHQGKNYKCFCLQ